MKKENWIWMPHPAHLCVWRRCQFRLSTYVGGYIVSTIGEWQENEGKEFSVIGNERLYETMVFKAIKGNSICCPYEIIVEKEVDFQAYNDSDSATEGHMKLCNKWSKRK